jgi:hypothetical protein
MAHPLGPIHVELDKQSEHLIARIELPKNLSGEFVFHGRVWPLASGRQEVKTEMREFQK